MSSIFLSHNSKDKPFVRELAKRLSSDGILVWLDEAEINVGDSLIEKISTGIQEMDFVAAIISINSIGSSWVQKELSLAMSKEIQGKKIVVLPILIDSCNIPSYISDKLYADFRIPENYEEGYYSLLKAIKNHQKANVKTTSLTSAPVQTGNPIKDFIDLSLIGVDKQKTQISRPGTSMYNVYLELSFAPPQKWSEVFESERRFPRHSMWRNAMIRGKYIIVECPLDELEKYHLRDIKEDISNSNAKYRGILFQEQQSKLRLEEELKKQTEKKNDILDNLNI
ncbi:toll/interleukin-1 receptor domain-containing protein [Leptospira adleri]|uniref:TIR domain-containing protein n=1 Tax=Leptospira adleri TaxID=2023186 RepID=A0ABX4NS71_9LEPT|nr:toll/interleukin-1 receptor domain-containing protein [Leptospira adleri]PJZ59686.1 hypothetical protein CH376_22465 [Leptospira adleri]